MTRTLLVLALLFAMLVPAFAQDTFTWIPEADTVYADKADLEAAFYIELTNITDQEREYTLEFLGPTPNSEEWSRSWCTYGNCYAPLDIFRIVYDVIPAQSSDPDCHVQIGFTFDNEPEVPDTTLYIDTHVYDSEFPDDIIETHFVLIIGLGSDVTAPPVTQPLSFELAPVYPNPFNAQTTVNFTLPSPGQATLALFDVTGRQVATLSDGYFAAGSHQVTLLANQLGSGTYFLRLNAVNQQQAQRITLVK